MEAGEVGVGDVKGGISVSKMSAALAILSCAMLALPASATRYVEVKFRGVAHTSVPRDDDSPIWDDYNIVTNGDFLFNLDEYELGTDNFPSLPSWGFSYLFLNPDGFSAFFENFPPDGFSADLSLGGMDFSKNFTKTFAGNGDFTAIYSYSRYEIEQDVTGAIQLAQIRSFDSDTPIDSSASVSTAWVRLPEPASWAMMLAGFGLVGGVLRRARKTGVSFA